MAKAKVRPKSKPSEELKTRPVRLDISTSDHERLKARAEASRLSMAAYARMALVKFIEAEEQAEHAKQFKARRKGGSGKSVLG